MRLTHTIISFASVFVLLLNVYSAHGQVSEENGLAAISLNSIKAHVGFLASAHMEGRETGTRGEKLASDYLASMLQLYNIMPWGDPDREGNPTYFQNFELTKTLRDSQKLEITSEGNTLLKCDLTSGEFAFEGYSGFQDNEAEGELVFLYRDALKVSSDLDSYNLEGRFILVPGNTDPGRKKEIESILRQKGALGIISLVLKSSLLNMASSGEELFSFPGQEISDRFIRVAISDSLSEVLLGGSDITPEHRVEKGQVRIIAPLGKRIHIKTTVTKTRVFTRNVTGIIEGQKNDEFLVIGAHYDHVGMHNGMIWYGADDNASGTAGVLTLANAFMNTGIEPERPIIVALWAAEEKGLFGSQFFVSRLAPDRKIVLHVNFDMISRYVSDSEPDKVTMSYTDATFPVITSENLKRHNIDLDVTYVPLEKATGVSDHRSFDRAGIPVMRFKPGHREEYHTPYDVPSTLDWDIMERILRISFLNIWTVANPVQYEQAKTGQ